MIWKPALLLAVKRADKAGLDAAEIADSAGLTVDEVAQALSVLAGRSIDQAADLLNGEGPIQAEPTMSADVAAKAAPAGPPKAKPAPYRSPTRRARGASIGPRLERLAVQVKVVTDRIARWAWWFVAAGWEVGEVAYLFDVDEGELDRRVMALDGGMC